MIENLVSGCTLIDPNILNEIAPNPSIYTSIGSIIDPCFLEALEALNEDILPTTTGNQVPMGYLGCFAEITTQGGYYEVKITFKNPLCVDAQGTGVQLMKFTVRDENGNVIPLYETESFTNPTIADLPSTFPNNYLADAYSGVSVQVNPSNGSAPYTGYIVFSLDGGNLDCTVITPGEEEIPFPDGCVDNLIAEAITIATEQWQQDVDAILTEYYNELDDCMDITETFYVEYLNAEHHYTLYYYDQAGNLVRTITPEGVMPVASTNFSYGIWNGQAPDHDNTNLNGANNVARHSTIYEYNSIQQVIRQESPDGGETTFTYNSAGQLRLSQNAKQAPNNQHSYTKYDKQARIVEVGQIGYMTGYSSSSLDDLNWPEDNIFDLQQKVNTIYDDVTTTSINQENLRGRVTSSYNEHLTTHYTYDVHGNVQEILHDYTESVIPDVNISYDYDLISGNVNEVQYQPNKVDQFYHKYEYDADNRLTHVYTSEDGDIWDQDARYFYYVHGPLARVEIGEDKVQGMDYYYNLQGWIKGVNQPGYNSHQKEMGQDGNNVVTNINKNIARDEYSYYLGYYEGDYTPIGATGTAFDAVPLASWDDFGNAIKSKTFADVGEKKGLFNGNIAMMITDIDEFSTTGVQGLQAMAYQYDQLHRIKNAASFQLNEGTYTANNKYDVNYTYDGNGNIQKLNRWGHLGQMDKLDYIYNTAANKPNQLLTVFETIGANVDDLYENDVDASEITLGGLLNFYEYDEIGNLISDKSEEIEEIRWNVQGKVDAVIFTTAGHELGRRDIFYTYDPAGNRLSKSINQTINGPIDRLTTYYTRDASGNVMSIYEHFEGFETSSFKQKEVPLYGSSRLGNRNFKGRNLQGTIPITSTRKRGQKTFEMSNHLSNVLVTLSDKVQGISTGGNATEANYYEAIVVSANDYYPFGMAMPGRKDAQDYRYGFNGKENDKDWGMKFIQDYGFRLYNPSIARFLSVDPLSPEYPWYTPYQFAGNKPIYAIDLDGLEELPWYLNENKYGGKPVFTLGLPSLPIVKRREYVANGYRGEPPISIFLSNSLGTAWNGIALSWNDAREGKHWGAHESIAKASEFFDKAKYEDYQRLATDIRTYESITGVLFSFGITHKITNLNSVTFKKTNDILQSRGPISLSALEKNATTAFRKRGDLVDFLKGKTNKSNEIANGIEDGSIRINLLGEEMFQKAYKHYGGDDDFPLAFNYGDQIYIRNVGSKKRIAGEVIHEGTHGLDFIRGYGGSNWSWEKRAYFHERVFQKTVGLELDFDTINDLIKFVKENYDDF